MKKLISLALVVLLFTVTVNAQQGKQKMNKRADFTPEQMATLQSKKMALHLDLNDNQQKGVFKLMKKSAEERQQKMADFKQKRQDGVKPSSDQKFQFESERLEKQLAHKSAMKKILTPEQFEKWNNSTRNRMSKGPKQGNKKMGKSKKKGQNCNQDCPQKGNNNKQKRRI